MLLWSSLGTKHLWGLVTFRHRTFPKPRKWLVRKTHSTPTFTPSGTFRKYIMPCLIVKLSKTDSNGLTLQVQYIKPSCGSAWPQRVSCASGWDVWGWDKLLTSDKLGTRRVWKWLYFQGKLNQVPCQVFVNFYNRAPGTVCAQPKTGRHQNLIGTHPSSIGDSTESRFLCGGQRILKVKTQPNHSLLNLLQSSKIYNSIPFRSTSTKLQSILSPQALTLFVSPSTIHFNSFQFFYMISILWIGIIYLLTLYI